MDTVALGEALARGDLDAALPLADRLVIDLPDDARAFRLAAATARMAGRTAEAIERARRAVALEPRNPLGWGELGYSLLGAKADAEAAETFRQGIAATPGMDFLHAGLGEALKRANRNAEAEAEYRRAIDLDPGQCDARIALGFLQISRGAPQAALADLQRAVSIDPTRPQAWLGLALASLGSGATEQAETAARRVLALAPTHTEALAILAVALESRGRPAEAEEAFAASLSSSSEAVHALQELAESLHNMGRTGEAIALYRRLARDPAWARRSMHKLTEVQLDHPGLDMAAYEADRIAWGKLMTAERAPASHGNDPNPDRRLRVGFVGSVFCANSSRHLIRPVIRAHDRSRYEVFLYSNTRREDAETAAYRDVADRWHSIRALDAAAASRMIRDHGIDILVDLNGLSEDHRLDIFALKPAPVQVTAWGYPSGTGLTTVDALFTDRISVDPSEHGHIVEPVRYLPCWACFDWREIPATAPLPPLSEPTFGALSRIRKLTDICYDAWAELLRAVPGSRFAIKDFAFDDPLVRARVRDAFGVRGVGPARLDLVSGTSRQEHLAFLARLDVSLSPFPHTGGVTTFESLLLGVPVVALDGNTISERNSSAILDALGLREWIGVNVEDYIAIAQELIADRAKLAVLKRTLPARLREQAICNADVYMRSVDEVYRDLWRAWCAAKR